MDAGYEHRECRRELEIARQNRNEWRNKARRAVSAANRNTATLQRVLDLVAELDTAAAFLHTKTVTERTTPIDTAVMNAAYAQRIRQTIQGDQT